MKFIINTTYDVLVVEYNERGAGITSGCGSVTTCIINIINYKVWYNLLVGTGIGWGDNVNKAPTGDVCNCTLDVSSSIDNCGIKWKYVLFIETFWSIYRFFFFVFKLFNCVSLFLQLFA